MLNKRPIPVFFAVDDGYAPCLAVAIRSLIANATPTHRYAIHVLVDALSDEHRRKLGAMATDRVSITFTDVQEKLKALHGRLHLRDYYTSATYYRFFIPDLFPQYDRGIYLDCDVAVLRDLRELYEQPLKHNLLAAVPDEVVLNIPVFNRYAEKVLGVPPQAYFNAGVLVMNLKQMRRAHLDKALSALMEQYAFPVAQDQDYLNVLCYGRTQLLDIRWNKTAFPGDDRLVSPFIAHYKLSYKPWHYEGVAYETAFWHYAAETAYRERLEQTRRNYTDTQKTVDKQQYDGLVALAEAEINKAVRMGGKRPVPYALGRRSA